MYNYKSVGCKTGTFCPEKNCKVVTLKYKDESDRAYGLGGMAVCMFMLEMEQYIDDISLDSKPDEGLRLTVDFFHSPNQQLSAKSVWKENLNRFQLTTGLLVSNVLSRALVRHNEDVSRELGELLISKLTEEGTSTCALEKDEIRDLYYKTFSFFHGVFSDYRVASMLNDFVNTLMEERILDRERIYNSFRALMSR